jgi:cysteine-rich repeat protein
MEIPRMSARHFSSYSVILATFVVSSCTDPEPIEHSRGQRDVAPLVAQRARFVASHRSLAPRTGLAAAVTPAAGQSLVDALDIPAAFQPTFQSLAVTEPEAAAVRTGYGVIKPTHHGAPGTDSFVLLSTGLSDKETVNAEPGTDLGLAGPGDDITTLKLQVTIPAGVNRMSFDYTFLSAESPDFVGTQFNDTFTVTVSDALGANRVIESASVNSAVFHPASDTAVGPCPFQLYVDNPAGVNTVFNLEGFSQIDAGTTGYVHVDVPVSGGPAGGPVTITFDIRDLGDGILDSAVILDNVQFSALERVDPQGGMIDTFRGQVIRTTSTDPSDLTRLATGGVPVHAAAADGVTEVVLRANVPGPGAADFAIVSGDVNDGNLSADDGAPVWGTTAHTSAVLIGGKWFVFALYRSPPDFNRGGDTAVDSRSAALAMDFTPAAGAAVHQDSAIDLVRPPVVVVPDIWASCASWTDVGGLLAPPASNPSLQHFTVSCADYQATSSQSFDLDDNRSALDQAIRQAMQKLRDAGAAATRADVVGHGMGAVLARRYIDDPGYARFDNFNAGGINRLILMNAPNLGSRLIDEMVRTRNTMKQNDAQNGTQLWPNTKATLAMNGVRFDDGDQDLALQQMGTNSPIIARLGAAPARPTTVFYHAIVSTGGHDLTRTTALLTSNLMLGGIAGAVKSFYITMELNHPDMKKVPLPPGIPNKQSLVFGTANPAISYIFCLNQPVLGDDQHDLFTTAPEQAGGLLPAFTTVIPVATAASASGHFKVQNDPDHTTDVIALLNAAVNGGKFATSMPAPSTVATTNGCPILPPVPTAPLDLAPQSLLPRTIAITSPVTGASVVPGSSVPVTLDAQGGETPESVLILGTGGSELIEAAPFTTDIRIPADAVGVAPLRAIAFYADGGMAFADQVTLNVSVTAAITSLEVVNGDQVLRRPGRTRRLSVLATYGDGIRRSITGSALGTKYTVSQLAPIVSVSDDGVITALGSGDATVAITNGPAITSINVKVGAATCGDGVLDPGEECDDGNALAGDHCDPTCHIENAAPVAVCSSPTQCNDPGLCSANITNLGASSFDPDGDPLSFSQSPAGPYGVGQHLVSVDVSDGQLDARCSSTVHVLDCEKPALTCPAAFTAECTSPGGAEITPPAATATDNCSAVVQAPGAGQRPLGPTPLGYTATDPSGNTSICTTTVTVQDTTPPSITCPAPIVAECTHHGKAFVTPGHASSSDVCGDVAVAGPHPGLFPLGTTAVSYTSTDRSGNHASCSSTIQVVDTRPPHAEAERTVTLWPPNHAYHRVSLDDCDIDVHDACGGRLTADASQARITCVTSDEPDNARGHGDGDTGHDIVLVDDRTVKLRAEREGSGDGRVYQIHFEVRDEAGNRGEGVCSVVVPHDQECARYPGQGHCRVHAGPPASSVCTAASSR